MINITLNKTTLTVKHVKNQCNILEKWGTYNPENNH